MKRLDFQALNAQIRPADQGAMAAAQERWNNIAKPLGSLGLLEEAVVRLAGMQGTPWPRIDERVVLVLAADNGVLAQGVAQTPAEITAVMAGYIAQGRSAVGLMAKEARADLIVADLGMLAHPDLPELRDLRVAAGTADMTLGPAMSRCQAEQAIASGMELVREAAEAGYQILATGEMGIGNTTTSSAVAALLLGQEPSAVIGRGAGLSDAGLLAKGRAVERAIRVNQPDAADPLDVLHKLGGFDIAGLAGAFIGGGLYGIPMIVDGFISSVAALAAVRLCPKAAAFLLPSHLSAEPAAALVMEALGLTPLIRAGMRLGEGTGAVAALPLLDMALAVYRELPTFSEIGM